MTGFNKGGGGFIEDFDKRILGQKLDCYVFKEIMCLRKNEIMSRDHNLYIQLLLKFCFSAIHYYYK